MARLTKRDAEALGAVLDDAHDVIVERLLTVLDPYIDPTTRVRVDRALRGLEAVDELASFAIEVREVAAILAAIPGSDPRSGQ